MYVAIVWSAGGCGASRHAAKAVLSAGHPAPRGCFGGVAGRRRARLGGGALWCALDDELVYEWSRPNHPLGTSCGVSARSRATARDRGSCAGRSARLPFWPGSGWGRPRAGRMRGFCARWPPRGIEGDDAEAEEGGSGVCAVSERLGPRMASTTKARYRRADPLAARGWRAYPRRQDARGGRCEDEQGGLGVLLHSPYGPPRARAWDGGCHDRICDYRLRWQAWRRPTAVARSP